MQSYRASRRLLHFELQADCFVKGNGNILHACVPQNLLETLKAWTESLGKVEKRIHGRDFQEVDCVHTQHLVSHPNSRWACEGGVHRPICWIEIVLYS